MSTESYTPVDPRVQIELEKLNTATDNINKFEVELDEAKCEFKKILAESVVRIKQSAHKLGNSIEAAKPYYESRIYAAQLTKETQTAAVNYEKAKSIHAAAKEMVYLAEQGLGEKSTLDTACQEMLSHAASKVNQSQLEVTDARNSLKMCQLKLEVANNRVGKLQGQLRQAIKASSCTIRRELLMLNMLAYQRECDCSCCSAPYYETRANYNGLLKTQKLKINDLEGKVSDAKMTYNEALKNLEQISEEIHRQRQQQKNLLNYEAMLQQAEADERQRRRTLGEDSITDAPNDATIGHHDHLIDNYQRHFPCVIDSTDEYLQMPDQLSTHSSPIRQRQPDVHDCPHLLRDFEAVLTFPQKLAGGMHKSASTSATTSGENVFATTAQLLHGPYDVNSSAAHDISSSTNTQDDNDIEQWTEIRLSHSDSTSSSYSNQSLLHDQHEEPGDRGCGDGRFGGGGGGDHSSSSSDEPKRKVTCTTIFHEETSKKQGLSQWLSRSNSFKVSGRRQSLDLLIDAGDKVKDVFSFGFQRVGRSLERRNSESEMNSDDGGGGGSGGSGLIGGGGGGGSSAGVGLGSSNTSSATDFFLFSRSSEPKELLSDEQVENLLISHRVDEMGAIIVEELKSPLQQPSSMGSTVGAVAGTSTTSSFFL